MLMQDNNPPKTKLELMISRITTDIMEGFWRNGGASMMIPEQTEECRRHIEDQVAKIYFGVHPRLEMLGD